MYGVIKKYMVFPQPLTSRCYLFNNFIKLIMGFKINVT